ncbi:hypothetical protein LHO93_002569 [Vibrio parahaemolyticus]|uniref:hypothetical protein n=1 Tax=Vibrio parahaemolyticus TaxID=670 RepID=UPI00040ACF93|nr:hypothetical protein [Vibrio parahaemolyticus]EGQ8412421.1 hypothetical protein [Vibrio parahaemolyticus]EGQ9446587.1 hypothetical protein [Vibrio parahaemolyticus]EGQ9532934.1 hypothetical protein [Vibrio parahaemolyticus]EHY0971209.1 hypothetical protein [Vibrio parahaemolyticus]EHZ7336188.1 hypothetical protein [Vibrio parahaemolyticus]
MHSLFAIEPEAIDNWADFRYTVEKFGYSNGLLIARYPKRWFALVMEACRKNGLGDIQLKRIEEKLSQIKQDRVYKFSQSYDSEIDWIHNTTSDAICSQLDAILTKADFDNAKVHPLNQVDENLFQNRRDINIKRTANCLAESAKFVISDSSKFTLVDPYFQSKNRCLKVLVALLTVCGNMGRKNCDFVIHTAYSKYPISVEQFKNECTAMLAPFSNDKTTIQVVRWSDDYLDFDFHARYFISEKAGLRIDRGFVEPEDVAQRENMTDLTCMDENRKNEILSQFSNYEGNPKVIDHFQLL